MTAEFRLTDSSTPEPQARLQATVRSPAIDAFMPEVRTVDTIDAAAPFWRTLEPACAATPFQTVAWHRAAASARAPTGRPTIIMARDGGREPLFVIPLVLERSGPTKVLRWLAGPDASYGGGLFRADFAAALAGEGSSWLGHLLSREVPSADAAVLLDQRNDEPLNPFAALPQVAGAGDGYTVTLGKWEEIYAARFNRRARHNNRRREKRLADIGPWTTRFATDPAERDRLMDLLFAQKSAWLKARGISDFLADPQTRTLLKDIVREPGDGLEAWVALLEVAGSPAAISFALADSRRAYSLITSTTEDGRILATSPGDILFRAVLEEACHRGLASCDLGIGSNLQKDTYADARFRCFHTLVPLTLEGHLYTSAVKARLAAKRTIKETPSLWRAYERLRRLRATGPVGADAQAADAD